MTPYFEKSAIQSIDRFEEILIQSAIAKAISLSRTKIVFRQPSASCRQSDYILRVGVDQESALLGLNRIEGPQEGLQLEFRGRGIFEALDLYGKFRPDGSLIRIGRHQVGSVPDSRSGIDAAVGDKDKRGILARFAQWLNRSDPPLAGR